MHREKALGTGLDPDPKLVKHYDLEYLESKRAADKEP